MQFDTDPEKGEYLKDLLFVEINKIVDNGPTAEDLDKVVKNMLKNREQSKQHNRYWMSALNTYLQHGYNSDLPENFDTILNEMSVDDMKKFTANFMADADVVDVIFKPTTE